MVILKPDPIFEDMIKKLFSLIMLLVSLATANAKCDFSKVKLQQWNNGTYYKWYLSGWDEDSCKSMMFLMYDNQTKKIDTLNHSRGYTDVIFNAPGTYKLYVKLIDKCNKCDTALYRIVEIQRWSPKASYVGKLVTCDSLVGEMTLVTSIKDTCYSYYYTMYNGSELNNLSDRTFDTMSDYNLINYYSFNQSDIQYSSDNSRIIKYKFPKKGKYLLVVQYYNKCNGQDTFFLRRYNIDCNSTGIATLKIQEPKLIGVYDLMGRPVANIRKNEIMIYLYDDGKTKKVIHQ